LFGIRKGLSCQMQLNTHLNNLLGCPLALHKFQIDSVVISTEAVDFGHGSFETPTASPLS
jgi:hypothetical protein